MEAHKGFYNRLDGSTYRRARYSWFLPRRLWHKIKNAHVASLVCGQRILDVGCGSGNVVELLRDRNVVGVDLNRNFVVFCHKTFPEASFIQCDAQHLPFKIGSFDTVVCSEVLEHLPDPQSAVLEFCRIGNRMVLTVPNSTLMWKLLEYVWKHVRQSKLELDHHAFTKEEIAKMCSFVSIRKILFGCLILASA